MNIIEAESLLRSELEGALADGVHISRRGAEPLAFLGDTWRPIACCAVGAAARYIKDRWTAHPAEDWLAFADAVLEPLGIPAALIGDGWDGTPLRMYEGATADDRRNDKRWWDLGDRLARDYAGRRAWP